MAKPVNSTEWATDTEALKIEPNAQRQQWGWSTSDNTVNGTPDKPDLNTQNGWQNIVHQWVLWLNSQTSENEIISGNNIDWSLSNKFSETLTANKTYSFSDIEQGQSIEIAITASGGDVEVEFPSLVQWPDGIASTTVSQDKTNVYRFSAFGSGQIYATAVENLEGVSWPTGADGNVIYTTTQTIVVDNSVGATPPDWNEYTVNAGVTITYEPTDPTRPVIIGAVDATILGTVKIANNDTETNARNYNFSDPNGIAFSGTRAAATALGGSGGRGNVLTVFASGGSGSIQGGGGGGGGSWGAGASGGAGGSNGGNGGTGQNSSTAGGSAGAGGAGGQATVQNGFNGQNTNNGGKGGNGYSGGGGGGITSIFGDIVEGGGGGGGGNKGTAAHALYFNAKTLQGNGLFDARGANGQNAGNGSTQSGGQNGGGGGGGPGGNGGLLWIIIDNDLSTISTNVNGGAGGSGGSAGGPDTTPAVGGGNGQTGTTGQVFTS